MKKYLVKHEIYQQEFTTEGKPFGKTMIQEWEEWHWADDFHRIGEISYHNGDQLHICEILA